MEILIFNVQNSRYSHCGVKSDLIKSKLYKIEAETVCIYVHLFFICVSDAWALLLGLYGRYFYIDHSEGLRYLAHTVLAAADGNGAWWGHSGYSNQYQPSSSHNVA